MSTGEEELLDVEEKLRNCEEALNYRFRNRELLERSLTHSSVARTRLASNERLEFLGDAILGTIVCEMLYHRFPEESEGELTRIKSVLVSRNTCAMISEDLGLEQFLLLGKGLSTHEKIPLSIMAAVFEALVAGVYLDGGLEAAREFVEPLVAAEIDRATQLSHLKNYKSVLQQVAQKVFNETPVYRLLDEKGPDHSKCFQVGAAIGSLLYPPAWGPSKKEAEQRAARNALFEIEGRDAPDVPDEE
jgi:ribonuclease III